MASESGSYKSALMRRAAVGCTSKLLVTGWETGFKPLMDVGVDTFAPTSLLAT